MLRLDFVFIKLDFSMLQSMYNDHRFNLMRLDSIPSSNGP